MARGNFNIFNSDISVVDENGKPERFDYLVRKLEHKATGRPMSESIEDQINRIDRLLNEKDDSYDLRIYRTNVVTSMSGQLGGESQEVQTEIRGVEGVTTVKTLGDAKKVGDNTVATYEIKFELLGTQSREAYRDKILIPSLMKIKGLKILRVSPISQTNIKGTIRTVREALNEYGGIANFGGRTSDIARMRATAGVEMRTPRATLQDVLDDWVGGGVKLYDDPAPTDHMRYHVMFPVSELYELMGREFRAPKDSFDGMYRNFIKNGPSGPVYIALGQNGRAKITGNEDIVWFAKKSGLKEVPVFFSYQRQV